MPKEYRDKKTGNWVTQKYFYEKVKFWVIIIPLVLMLLMTPTYWERCDTNKYCLARTVYNGEVDTGNVYSQGLHPIGFFVEFIEFPTTQQTIQFFTSEENSVNSRTQDGLEIFLDVSFQYQLEKSGIGLLFKEFGTEYESVFWRVARDVIRDTASLYRAIEFFNNRTLIGGVIEDNMINEFEVTYGTGVPAFQLLDINLPDTFEDALERLEVAKQDIEIAKEQQAEALIRAETKIIEAQAAAEVTVLEAEANAEAFLINIEAQAEAVNITLTAQANSYYALAQALGLNSTELLAYLWIQALTEIGENGNLIIIGENTPQILVSEP